jgi:hypothetical protein
MPAVHPNAQRDVTDVAVFNDTAHVDLWYPRLEGKPKYLEVGLVDVRASDNIRISYDFERDGWKIEQASIFEWDNDDEICDAGWLEVAFVQAWGRKP